MAAMFLAAFVIFCNVAMLLIVGNNKKEKSFHEEWKREVEDCQDRQVGRIFMKIFYFLPTLVAVASQK